MQPSQVKPGMKVAIATTDISGIVKVTGKVTGRIIDGWGQLTNYFVIELDEPLDLKSESGIRIFLKTVHLSSYGLIAA